jgi:glycerate-2-kinase
MAAAAGEARQGGFAVMTGDLAGEAAAAARLLVARGRALGGERVALVLGGETTVTLGPESGRGGRNQELALAAARELAGGGDGELVLTLASDGEDGPTSAAGGIVDGTSWEKLERAGAEPAAALARHDSNRALAALPGALLETGNTGTNVGDLAVYLRW